MFVTCTIKPKDISAGVCVFLLELNWIKQNCSLAPLSPPNKPYLCPQHHSGPDHMIQLNSTHPSHNQTSLLHSNKKFWNYILGPDNYDPHRHPSPSTEPNHNTETDLSFLSRPVNRAKTNFFALDTRQRNVTCGTGEFIPRGTFWGCLRL